jgi:hypothetical protein
MLGSSLREEFRGAGLRGTTIDFTNDAKTGALDQSASDFLRITYPSVDLGCSDRLLALCCWMNFKPGLTDSATRASHASTGHATSCRFSARLPGITRSC